MAVSVVPMPSVDGSARVMSCRVLLAAATASASAPSICVAVVQVLVVERGDGGDRDRAGDLPCGMAAHAVGDHEKMRARVSGVFIALAEQSDV